MSRSATQARRGDGLGWWIWAPLLALLLLCLVASRVPSGDCSGEDPGGGTQLTIALVFAALASLGAFVAAGQRLIALHSAGSLRPRRDLGIAVAAALAFLVSIAAFTSWLADDVSEGLLLIGPGLTAVALLALLLAWATGLRPVGLLLPVYLIGLGLFAYPFVAFLTLISNSGVGC